MNTCPEQIVHNMHAYLDDDLSPDDGRELMEHLKECPSCNELMTR